MVREKPVPFPPEPVRWAGIEATRRSMERADANGGGEPVAEDDGQAGAGLRLLGWHPALASTRFDGCDRHHVSDGRCELLVQRDERVRLEPG